MNLEAANALPIGSAVVHMRRGPGIWWGVDEYRIVRIDRTVLDNAN